MLKIASTDIRRVLFSSSLGGSLEMYDFVLFIFFAPIIARHFLPLENSAVALIYTLLIFAMGYFMRPLGGLLFGHFGDRYGRKRGLLIAIWMMGLATLTIGCLPSFAHIGYSATALLILCRLLQGIAVGGDLPGSLLFTAEHSEHKSICLNISLVFLGINLGALLAAAVVAIVHSLFSRANLVQWGWRIPFLISLLLLFVGQYLRRTVAESAAFLELGASARSSLPIKTLWSQHSELITRGCGTVALFALCISLIFLYMPTYLQLVCHLSAHVAAIHNVFSIMLFCCCLPLCGFIYDRSQLFNYKTGLFVSGLVFFVFGIPLFVLLAHLRQPFYIQLLLLVFDVVTAILVSSSVRVLVALFPTKISYTGIGLCYNLCFAVLGGLSPVYATIVINHQHPSLVGVPLCLAAGFLLLTRIWGPQQNKVLAV